MPNQRFDVFSPRIYNNSKRGNMSSISGVGGANLLQYLQQSSRTDSTSQTSGSNSLKSAFETAIQDAGGSNVNFSDLNDQIEAAVKNTVQNASGSTDLSTLAAQVKSAVDQVLTANGIDTSKLQSEMGSPPSGPPPGGPPPGGPPPSGGGGTSGSSTIDLSSLLSSLTSSSTTSSSSSTSSTSDSSSTNTSDSTTTTQSNDELIQKLLQDVFKNMPAGTLVNTTA